MVTGLGHGGREEQEEREKEGDIEGRGERCGIGREKRGGGETGREGRGERMREERQEKRKKAERKEGDLGQGSRYLHGGHSPSDLPSSPQRPR